RFRDLRADLPGISANVLTQRLEGLERAGILVRRQLPPPASVQVYELTEWGYQAKPLMGALGRWATRSPGHDPRQHLSAVSLMLSFQAMGQPALLKGLNATILFRLRGETYTLRIADGAIDARRGAADDPDLIVTADAGAVAAAVYGGVPLEALEDEGALRLEGDRALAARFVTLFPLPPKAQVPG
ncbi:MAG: winged helix-turn-helix transcriptional regulator, partial [Sphingosinicella sp.]|uniref:winged helix-turn-helix transcriptional regulator n=1 Tax=Sphingosinicella sp. TaxID=1917971 RepID=UPI004037B34A